MANNTSHSCRMPRTGSLAVALVAAMGLVPMRASAAPKLSVPTLRQEIGELTAGETAEVAFPLSNTGTDPLTIEEVKTSCGCTTASYPQTLQPGEKGTLQVRLVSQPHWNGAVEKHITLRCNDPDRPRVELQLAAQLRPLFQFSPGSAIAVPYKKGEVLRQVVTITSASGRSVGITAVAPAQPGTEARLLPAESGDGPGVWRVEITARSAETRGDFTTSVTLQTTDRKVPAIPITLTGLAQDALAVSPPFLHLGRLGVAPDAAPPRFVTVYRRAGAFRVVEVKTDTPALKAEVTALDTPEADGRSSFYTLSVHYLGGWPKGTVTGKISVRSDDPAVSKLEIPYEATVE
jgi:Protein of unknown function (DUF1573)